MSKLKSSNVESLRKDPSFRRVKGKSRSVVEWARGIQHGTLQAQINIYYDNIKELDSNALDTFPDLFKDPWMMSSLELLHHEQRLKTFIHSIKSTDGPQPIIATERVTVKLPKPKVTETETDST